MNKEKVKLKASSKLCAEANKPKAVKTLIEHKLIKVIFRLLNC